MNFNHLDAIQLRLSHERCRLACATKPNEIAYRKHSVAQIEKELAGELKFLAARGYAPVNPVEMSDDELLAELQV